MIFLIFLCLLWFYLLIFVMILWWYLSSNICLIIFVRWYLVDDISPPFVSPLILAGQLTTTWLLTHNQLPHRQNETIENISWASETRINISWTLEPRKNIPWTSDPTKKHILDIRTKKNISRTSEPRKDISWTSEPTKKHILDIRTNKKRYPGHQNQELRQYETMNLCPNFLRWMKYAWIMYFFL